MVYTACGHDDERFTVKGDGTESDHPTTKCFKDTGRSCRYLSSG